MDIKNGLGVDGQRTMPSPTARPTPGCIGYCSRHRRSLREMRLLDQAGDSGYLAGLAVGKRQEAGVLCPDRRQGALRSREGEQSLALRGIRWKVPPEGKGQGEAMPGGFAGTTGRQQNKAKKNPAASFPYAHAHRVSSETDPATER